MIAGMEAGWSLIQIGVHGPPLHSSEVPPRSENSTCRRPGQPPPPFHQKKPAAVRIASGQINEQTARRRIGSCGSTAQGLERLPHKGLIFQHEERFSDCFRCLTRGAGASQILSGATMAVNSDRSSHRTKPALAVHTSDRSGDLRGRHAQTPAQIPPAGWCDVALRVFHGISENRIATISGGVTGQCREELTFN